MPFFGPPIIEKLKANRDVQGLIKALSYQKDAIVRGDAAEALGQIRDERALEPLIALLEDDTHHVRDQAAQSLGKLKHKRAVQPLINYLNYLDRHNQYSEAAVRALGEIGASEAVEPLLLALKTGHKLMERVVASALGRIGDKRSAKPLLAALSSDAAMLNAVALQLEKCHDPEFINELLDLIDLNLSDWLHNSNLGYSPGFNAIRELVEQLGKIREIGAMRPLGELIHSKQFGLAASQALWQLLNVVLSDVETRDLNIIVSFRSITQINYAPGRITEVEVDISALQQLAHHELIRRRERESTFSVLPLRGLIMYPHSVITLTLGQPRSIKLAEDATMEKRGIALVASKDPDIESPAPDDLYKIGTLATILRLSREPDGTIRLLVQGQKRIAIEEYIASDPYLRAKIRGIPETVESSAEVEALMHNVIDFVTKWADLVPSIPDELISSVLSIDNPIQLVYAMASNIDIDLSESQKLLELDSTTAKLQLLVKILDEEIANNETVITSSESPSGELPNVESPLAKGDDEEITKALALSYLTSSDKGARFIAAMTLAKLRDDRGMEVLLLMLKNDDDDVALDSVVNILYECAYTPEEWEVLPLLKSGGSKVDLNALMKPEVREVFALVESEAVDRLLKATSQVKSWLRDSPAIPMRKIIAIGRLLDYKGGKALMRNIHAEFSQKSELGRELEVMWSGIGKWSG